MIRYLVLNKKGAVKGNKPDYRIGKKDLSFIFLLEPTEKELEKVAKDFKLRRKSLYDYVKEPYSRSYAVRPFEFVMIDYFIENNRIESAHLLFVLLSNSLIIISNKKTAYYERLFDEFVKETKLGAAKSVGYLLYVFLQGDIEYNYEALEKTEEEIAVMEKNLLKYKRQAVVKMGNVTGLKRRLFKMGRQFWASARIISSIRLGIAEIRIDRQSLMLLGDVHATCLHQIEMASSQREMLTDLLEIYSVNISNRLAIISNELNIIMKKLAAFALIIMIPTFITGVYGMNFRHMPLLIQEHGFYVIIALMAAIGTALFAFFRRMKWL